VTIRIPPARGLILVAEGDKSYARALKSALQAASVEEDDVLLLSDGNQLMKFLLRPRSPVPRVLLVDIWLPKWPGLEILSWIRTQERFRSVPVVVMSTGADPGLRMRAYSLGANSFMAKPYADGPLTQQMALLAGYWRGVNLGPA